MKEQDAASVCHFGVTVKNWPKCRILQLFVLAARRIRGICCVRGARGSIVVISPM